MTGYLGLKAKGMDGGGKEGRREVSVDKLLSKTASPYLFFHQGKGRKLSSFTLLMSSYIQGLNIRTQCYYVIIVDRADVCGPV